MTPNEITNQLSPVVFALQLGWKACDSNLRAVKHFYYNGRVKFEVHWFRGEPSYTVGDTTTAYVPRRQLAHTIAHEFAHIRGNKHRDMRGPNYSYARGWAELYAWADEMPLRVKEAKPKPTTEETTILALQIATAGALRHERKLKLASTLVKKWRRRVRYYTNKLAALRVSAGGAL